MLTSPKSPRTPHAILLVIALAFGCGRPGPEREARSLAEMQRNFAYAPGIEVQGSERYARAAELLAAREGRPVTRIEAEAAGDPTRARVVIGQFDEPQIAALLERVAPDRDADGARLFLGERLDGTTDALFASFRDPDRPGLPILLIAAASEEALLRSTDDLRFPFRPGARLFLDGSPCIEVDLSLSGEPRPLTSRQLGPARRAAQRDMVRETRVKDPELSVRRARSIPSRVAASYAASVRAARNRLAKTYGLDAAANPCSIELVPTPADALAITGRVANVRPGRGGTPATALFAAGVPHDSGALAARELLVQQLGAPVAAWMADGAAVDAADRWWGEPLERADGGPGRFVPAIATIIDPASIDRVSIQALVPARALLHRFLLQRLGADSLRELWSGARALELDEALEADFRTFAQPVSPDTSDRLRSLPGGGAFLGGVVIDTAFRPGGALASPGLEEQLERAVAAGAKAVSFASIWFERPPAPDFGGASLDSGREAAEGDAAIAAAVASARAAGVEVVALAPRLLLSESAGYASQRRRQTLADWRDFFDAYDAMLAHYATLAQITGCDLLVIGTEEIAHFGESGRDDEVEQFVVERWHAAIARARGLFEGPMTYAARYPQESAVVPFWDRLDAVGATYFPDLVGKDGGRMNDRVATERMRVQLASLAEFAAELGLPALVLEAGFRSTRDASLESEVGPGEANPAEQARLYEALGRALKLSREEAGGPAGLFLWRWEVSGGGASPGDRGFSPQGKPAEAVLPGLFGLD